ncbi:MAG: cation transporter, partial [Alphaproteobacteria bacterium]
YRGGDSNRESVWICSRNDAIGNIAVMIAAAGVFASGTIWPDIIVAAILGWLAISGAMRIIKSAKREL